MKWRVLISCVHAQRHIDSFQDFLKEHDMEIEMPLVEQRLSESDLLKIIERFDGVVAGDDEFSARVLKQAKRLKVISKWGIGIDAIDTEAAGELGIRVFNTPDVFGDEVADIVIGYLILLSRQLHRIDQSVRAGGWLKVEGSSLHNKTLGIIGLGNIGQNVAQRALSARMNVLAYDIAPAGDFLKSHGGVQSVNIETLLENADYISLNCNLTAQNRHLLNEGAFSKMKNGVYIINTARGALIDEAALIRNLKTGKVAGAALDVFEEEPLPAGSALRQFESCIFGSHNSSNTKEAVLRVTEQALNNLVKGLL